MGIHDDCGFIRFTIVPDLTDKNENNAIEKSFKQSKKEQLIESLL